MFPSFKSLIYFKQITRYVCFFSQVGAVSKTSILKSFVYSTLTVATETLSLSLIFPIISYINSGFDEEIYKNASKINQITYDVLSFLNIPVALENMMMIAFCLITLRQIINYFYSVNLEHIKWNTGKQLGIQVFSSTLSSSADYLKNMKASDLTLLSDYESQATATILQIFITFWSLTISFVLYFSIMLAAAPIPSITMMLLIVIFSLFTKFLIKKTHELAAINVIQRKKLYNFIAERFDAWKVIKLLRTLKLENEKFLLLSQDIVNTRVEMAKLSSKIAIVFVPSVVAALFIFIYFLVEVLNEELTVLIAIGAIFLRLLPIAQSYQKSFAQLARFAPSLDRLDEILRETKRHREPIKSGNEFKSLRDEIKLIDVSFYYSQGQKPVLDKLNVSIPASSFVGIIGASGAGKTTLLDLISGLLPVSEGQIFYDNQTISDLNISSLRSNFAMVSQEPFLFDDTILENITYGNRKISKNKILQALSETNLLEFVNSLPNGINTRIGDRGNKLSVGQKQRLALARSIVSGAKIFFFDEPTSALDTRSEEIIIKLLKSLTEQGKTVIVIAHRLNTLNLSDKILFLENGKLIRQGPPNEVLDYYREVLNNGTV